MSKCHRSIPNDVYEFLLINEINISKYRFKRVFINMSYRKRKKIALDSVRKRVILISIQNIVDRIFQAISVICGIIQLNRELSEII